MFAYVWKDTPNDQSIGSTNTEPVVAIDCALGTPAAATAAANYYPTLAPKASGRRGLLLRHIGYEFRSDFGAMNDSLSFPSWLVNGFRIEGWAHWLTDFWVAWKAQGSVRPDDIILDTEYETQLDMTTAPATAEELEAAGADGNPLQRFIPTELRNLTVAQISAGYPNSVLTGYFDRFSRQRHADALQSMVMRTYTAVMGTACPPLTNFGNNIADGTYFSDYGRPAYPERTSLDGTSAPVCFIQTPASLPVPKYAGLSKAIRYNDFISTLNFVRGCKNIGTPWVSRWSFNGNSSAAATSPNGWTELMRHLSAMGVSRVIQFASGLTAPNIVTHEAVFASLTATPAASLPRNGYETIAYDAASVTTNGYTTTYSAGDWA